MGNFASSALRPVTIQRSTLHKVSMASAPETQTPGHITRFICNTVHSFKTTISSVYSSAIESFSGSSAVLSELEEAWYHELVGEIDAVCARCARCAAAPQPTEATAFLGPDDITVAPVGAWKSWSKASNHDDDTSSNTTEETDDESKYDFSDCEADAHDNSDSDSDSDDDCTSSTTQIEAVEYYAEDDDTETKADRLLRLSSMSSPALAPVYVDDYLCPCGECPQYARIAYDVQTVVTWRSAKEQNRIIRVLQAFSTYNEVIGYHSDMIEAAEECLQVWLGDEDRALNSLVMLYDEVPQLCLANDV